MLPPQPIRLQCTCFRSASATAPARSPPVLPQQAGPSPAPRPRPPARRGSASAATAARVRRRVTLARRPRRPRRRDACPAVDPPAAEGDPAFVHHAADIARATKLGWIGYLSTVAVYGDQRGGWVDETSPPNPMSERGKRRLAAENAWLTLGARSGKTVMVFRLPGIYGPGRSMLDDVADGTARRLIKKDQVFNRIHVDDIAGAVEAAIQRPRAGGIFNVVDDEPGATAGRRQLRRRPARPRAAARHAVRGRQAVADGAQLLLREQARAQRAPQGRTRLHTCLSHLPRRTAGDRRAHRLNYSASVQQPSALLPESQSTVCAFDRNRGRLRAFGSGVVMRWQPRRHWRRWRR